MPVQIDDFSGGVVTEKPDYLLSRGASPRRRNFIIDDDGTLLALPWFVKHLPEFSAANRYFQRSDVLTTHIEGTNGTDHAPPINYRLSSPNIGDRSFYARDGGTIISSWIVPTAGPEATAVVSPTTITNFSVSSSLFGKVGPAAGHTEYYVVSAPTETIEIRQITNHPSTGIPTDYKVATIGFVLASKWPLSTTVYRQRLWLAVDGSTGSSRNLFMVSDPGDFKTGYSDNQRETDSAIAGVKTLEETLWMFCVDRILALRGDFEQLHSDTICVGIGCVSTNSIQTYRNSFIYLSTEGFVLLSSSGAWKMLDDDNVRSRVKAKLATQKYLVTGIMDNLGGSSVIQNEDYWFVWPDGSEIWRYDFRRNHWEFYDSRCYYTDILGFFTTIMIPSQIVPSRDRAPAILFNDEGTTTIRGRRMVPAYRNSYKDSYTSVDDQASHVPALIELPTIGKDRDLKKIRYLLIDCEFSSLGDDRLNINFAGIPLDNDVWGIQIVDEQNRIVARGYMSKTEDSQPGTIERFAMAIPPSPYSETFTTTVFSSNRDLNRVVVDQDPMFPSQAYLKIHSVKWISDGDADLSSVEARKKVTSVSNENNFERIQIIGPATFESTLAFPWAVKTYAKLKWSTASTGLALITSSGTDPAAQGLVLPVLDGYDVWEAEYDLSGDGTYFAIALFSDFVNSVVDGAFPTLQVSFAGVPIRVVIANAAGTFTMTTTYYNGGTTPTTVVTTLATTGMVGIHHRLRVSRIPGTNTFMVDHSTPGTIEFPFRFNTTLRHFVHVYGRAGEVPLNPYIGIDPNADATHARIWDIICRPHARIPT